MSESSIQPSPRVSVVIGVYNSQATIAATLDSLLAQSMGDFEVIIIYDGSTDGTAAVLREYADRDGRIRHHHQSNGGVTTALINGCERAKGVYIARIDAGDAADPTRLQKQVEFLDAHPEVAALGTGVSRVGPEGERLGDSTHRMSADEFTERFVREGVGLCHPSSMYRADAFRSAGGYRAAFRFAQDTDLWFRISRQGLLAELPEPLLQLRIDTDGISPQNSLRQRRLADLARESYHALGEGRDDTEIMRQAEQASWGEIPAQSNHSPVQSRAQTRAMAEFFIGSQLFALGDARCRKYLFRAVRLRPFWIRPWVKILLSYTRGTGRVD